MSIIIETNIPASTQRTDWPNGTRYMAGAGLHTFTIQTHVTVPHHVDEKGPLAVAEFIRDEITAGRADFTILVGEADEDEHGE